MAKNGSSFPSKGEWAAVVGYEPQYSLAAQFAILTAKRGALRAVRLIDPNANTADDFQIVTDRRVDAFQVKWESLPSGFTFSKLTSLVNGLALGRAKLQQLFPESRVVVHIVTNSPASTSDSIKDSTQTEVGSFFEFRKDILEPSRNAHEPTKESLVKWADPLAELQSAAGVSNMDFPEFLRDFYVDVNTEMASDQVDVISATPSVSLSDIERVKAYFLQRVRQSSGDAVIEITAQEMLAGAGLRDRLDLRNRHEFPKPDIDYHPIIASREHLAESLASLPGGYLALVGPPGSGKSTLISEEFADPTLRVIRYYAFVPGTDLSGFLRGESEHFLHDLNVSLVQLGSHAVRSTFSAFDKKQELLGHLVWLNNDFRENGRRTIIFIDGLDHIPREQQPTRSLLADLPLPSQVPDGIYIVLGTQRVELVDLPIGIRQQIDSPDRHVEMSRLTKPQCLEISMAEFPEDLRAEELADRLYALSEGHPLSLAILIRQLRQPPPAMSAEEAIDRLKEVTFVGTDIDGYYERLWRGLEFDNETFDFLGRSCRDRLPISTDKGEVELGRSRFKSVLKRIGHLWQQDPSNHLHVFHNSFRLFLLRTTGTDTLGNNDASRHLRYHRQLVDKYTETCDPLEQWEVVFHLCQLNDAKAALEFVTIDRVREQLRHFRLPGTLFPDLRILLRLAFQLRDLAKVSELTIAWNELNLCDYALGGQYDAIARELLAAGKYSTALQMLTDGRAAKLGFSTCLEAAEMLLEVGRVRQAQALFHAAEPVQQLQQPEHDWRANSLNDWARIGNRFRRPHQMLRMIRKAALKSRHPNPASIDSEAIRRQLLTTFAGSLTGDDSASLLNDLDEELRHESRPSWLSLRLKRIRECSTPDRRRMLAMEVIDGYRILGPESLSGSERLLVAELAVFVCDDREFARRMLVGFPRPRLDDCGFHDEISRSQHDWFRLFRVREHLDESPDVAEIELGTESRFQRSTCFLTKHIARFGALASRKRRGLLPIPELIREIATTLRFMSQRTSTRFSDDEFRQVRRLRPAFLELVLDVLGDPECISEIATLVVASMAGEHGEEWSLSERIEAFHHFVDGGVDLAMCRSVLDDIELEWPTDEPDASSRADREVQLATAKNALGDHEEAVQHLRLAVTSHGTVDHRKDYQQADWCRFLSDVNLLDVDGDRKRRRTRLIVQASVAAAQTDAPSEGAATAAITDATRWNPQEGASLVGYLPELRAITFAQAAGTFVGAVVRSDEECAMIATAITQFFLVPLEGPAPELLPALASAGHGATLIASITSVVKPSSLPENRPAWYRAIVAAAGTAGIEQPSMALAVLKADRSINEQAETVRVGLDEEIKMEDVCKRFQTPEDFRKFREEAREGRGLRTHDLTDALCRRWDASEVNELSEIISQYDEDGREVMTCAERLEQLGEFKRAIELSKSVLLTCHGRYGDDWRWSGALLRAMQVLERLVDRKELRELVLAGLHRFVSSDGGFSPSGTELFTEIFPRICDDEELLEIADRVEQFLIHATRMTACEQSWYRDRGTAREALLDFVASRLSDPVNYLAEAARLTVVELLRTHALSDVDLQFLCRCQGDDPRRIRGLLAALVAVASEHADYIRPLKSWLIEASRIRDLGLRAEINLILADIGEDPLTPPVVNVNLLKLFSHEPIFAPSAIVKEEVDSTGFLEDTFDPERLAKMFLPEIKLLAKAAKIASTRVLRRVYEIAVSFGRETWSKQAEMDLRQRLENSSLRLTFQRLRTIAVERAIHQAAAELIDAGRLSKRDVGGLLTALRTSEPVLLRIEVKEMPAEIPLFNPPVAFTRDGEEWLRECEVKSDSVMQLLTKQLPNGVVLAESCSFREGREGYEESRVSNLWIDDAEPDNGEKLQPFDFASCASRYHAMALDVGAIAIRHFGGMELDGAHCKWVALNANAALTLNFKPDDSRLFGWTDGDDSIWTVRWIDGHPLVPPHEGSRGHGWMVVASKGVAEKLNATFSYVRRFCAVRRQKGELGDAVVSTAYWSEPFINF